MRDGDRMNGARAARQLRLIAETVEIAGVLGVQVWLRGGWAMDFFLGEVTRDHVDIDWFAWSGDATALAAAHADAGFTPTQVPGTAPDQVRDFEKRGEELSFALLDRDAAGRVVVAGGPWAGAPWPEGMLEAPPGRIGGLECPIIDPRAQIEIKQMMPVWVPERPRRAKDAADITRLQAALG
jgi:hypothetical protein